MFNLVLPRQVGSHSPRPGTVLKPSRCDGPSPRAALDRLLRALQHHHPETVRHALRVRHYALRLATALGLDRRQRQQLGLAATLHDLGKMALPRAVLDKPAALTAEEFRLVQEHPATAERFLAPFLRDREVLAAIRGHHERFDGTGYPDGLRGRAIPLLARVLAVADCYDAMTSDRPYKPALPRAQAAEALARAAGTQLDPELVELFLQGIAHPCASRGAGLAPAPEGKVA
jgi:HD-GYP domain-containing protein (c-di-GMP phosphodiesterase class II)